MPNSSHPSSNVLPESIPGQTTIDLTSNVHLAAVPPGQTSAPTVQVPPGQRVNLHRASVAALLVAPLVAIPPATRVLVDHAAPALAQEATATLDRAFAWRPVRSSQETGAIIPHPAKSYETETFVDPVSDTPNFAPHSAQPGSKQTHRGIVVRSDAVVRAVQSGGRPSSVPAPASGERPAGLSLIGVSHFGTGLHDGDILTSVGGTPATSEAAVIGLVAGAISQHAKVITGVVWRGEQRIDVSVEIPGPEAFTKTRRRPSVLE